MRVIKKPPKNYTNQKGNMSNINSYRQNIYVD